MVDVQVGQMKRPEVMPLVDEKPTHIDQVEGMVENGRFPKDEFETMKEKYGRLKERVEQIFIELRDMQKEVQEKIEEMDRQTFMDNASDLAKPLMGKYKDKRIKTYLENMLEDMANNLKIFNPQQQPQIRVCPPRCLPMEIVSNLIRSICWWTTVTRMRRPLLLRVIPHTAIFSAASNGL